VSQPLDLTAYDALSFDCYGTLIDWERGFLTVLRAWAGRSGLTVDDETLLTTYGHHEERLEAEHPSMLYPDVLRAAMAGLGADLDAAVSPSDADALATSIPQWPAFDDSPAALTELARHYRLVILSNVDRTSFAGSNARLGVTFDRVVTAQDVGSYKPSPRNFEALLTATDELGVPRGRLLHVAQSLFHDHVAAQAAGLPTVWINRRAGREGWGATPPPSAPVTPDASYPSMAAFAAAVTAAFAG